MGNYKNKLGNTEWLTNPLHKTATKVLKYVRIAINFSAVLIHVLIFKTVNKIVQ